MNKRKSIACEAAPAVASRCVKPRGRAIDAYAETVLDKSLSGEAAPAIHEWLKEQGCESSLRTVQDWIQDHREEREVLRQERLRKIAQTSEFADRVNRTRVMDKAAKRLVVALSSPADQTDMAFLNGASLPMLKELRELLKQIQDEVNDVEQPAKRIDLGVTGAMVHEVKRTIVHKNP